MATQHPLPGRVLGQLPILALLGSPLFAQEVKVPCGTGQSPICPGEWVDCSISPATDVDVFQFYAAPGETYRVTVDGKSNDFDPWIEVYDPSGVVISSELCSAPWNGTCSVVAEFDASLQGLHSIVLSDAGSNNAGGYALDLQQIVPSKNLVPVIDYGVSTTVFIGHGSDHDWLRFEATQGTRLRISVDGKTNDLDPRIEVYYPDGTMEPASCNAPWNGTCSVVHDIPSVPATGDVYVAFSDAGKNNTGSMDVTLTCVLGTCPPNLHAAPIGTAYCTGKINSTGGPALMSAMGSTFVTDTDVLLSATGAPPAKVGIFFMGAGTLNIPLGGSQGLLCVMPPVRRFPVQFTCNDGSMHYEFDPQMPPGGPPVQPGETWYFQAWYRDQNPGPSNTTDGLAITFQ